MKPQEGSQHPFQPEQQSWQCLLVLDVRAGLLQHSVHSPARLSADCAAHSAALLSCFIILLPHAAVSPVNDMLLWVYLLTFALSQTQHDFSCKRGLRARNIRHAALGTAQNKIKLHGVDTKSMQNVVHRQLSKKYDRQSN